MGEELSEKGGVVGGEVGKEEEEVKFCPWGGVGLGVVVVVIDLTVDRSCEFDSAARESSV